MEDKKALAWIRRVASIALMLCFVLPLSTCAQKADPADTAKAALQPPSTLHGFDLVKQGWNDLGAGKTSDGIAMLFAVFAVFFRPAAVLVLGARMHAACCLLASPASAFLLNSWVFWFSTRAEIGGLLAVACWALLFCSSGATLFRQWRDGRLFRRRVDSVA